MKKSKTIFIIVLTLLLSVISIGIISLYDGIKESVSDNRDHYSSDYISECLDCFTYAMALDLDPELNIISNDENLTDQQNQLLQKELTRALQSYKEYGYEDSYFIFSIKNTTTNEIKSNHLDLLEDQSLAYSDKYRFYEHIVFDENGNVTQDGEMHNLFSKDILDRLFGNTFYTDDYSYDEEVNDPIDISQVQTNKLKNLDITYIIPEKMSGDTGFVSSEFYSPQQFQFFSITSLIVATIIIAVFILFYPIHIVEEVNPFYTIKSWKAEIIFVIFSCAITFGIIGCVAIVNFTLNDSIREALESYQISQTNLIIPIINFIIWFATLFFIICGLFIIKYIFVYGIWNYIKDKTIFGSICRYIKKILTKVDKIDLSDSWNKIIMQYILVNTGVIIVFITIGGIAYFLVIIYAACSFFFIKNRMDEIQNDYDKLLKATSELNQGHFDIEINEDVGIFHNLKDEFNHIKIGFEKAVQEETKSQNMKTELISNVSHDLKTPLTCIKNYIVLLQDDNLSIETRHEYLENLDQYSNRLTTLIEDLFEVSKVNSGNVQLDLVKLNIVALVEQALAESQDLLEARGLTVINHYAHDEILLHLDGGKTYRILENLLTNISKYAMPHSRVYIDIQENSKQVIMIFKNMSQEQMNFTSEEIVERFVRGDKARHETGSGLGLAIAKSFTEVQGGKFSIDIDGDLFKAILVFNKEA